MNKHHTKAKLAAILRQKHPNATQATIMAEVEKRMKADAPTAIETELDSESVIQDTNEDQLNLPLNED